jgi:hypothetical protein
MEIVGDSVSHSSDFFDLLADYAVKIIKAGRAYADDTDGDTVSGRLTWKVMLNYCTDEGGKNARYRIKEPRKVC